MEEKEESLDRSMTCYIKWGHRSLSLFLHSPHQTLHSPHHLSQSSPTSFPLSFFYSFPSQIFSLSLLLSLSLNSLMSFFLLRQAYALYLVSSTIEPDLLIFISSLSSSPLLLWTPPTLKFPLILASLRLHSPSFALFYCPYGFRAPNFAASGRNIRFVFELTVCLAAEKILRNYKRKRRWNWESCNYGLITCPTRLKVVSVMLFFHF